MLEIFLAVLLVLHKKILRCFEPVEEADFWRFPSVVVHFKIYTKEI